MHPKLLFIPSKSSINFIGKKFDLIKYGNLFILLEISETLIFKSNFFFNAKINLFFSSGIEVIYKSASSYNKSVSFSSSSYSIAAPFSTQDVKELDIDLA